MPFTYVSTELKRERHWLPCGAAFSVLTVFYISALPLWLFLLWRLTAVKLYHPVCTVCNVYWCCGTACIVPKAQRLQEHMFKITWSVEKAVEWRHIQFMLPFCLWFAVVSYCSVPMFAHQLYTRLLTNVLRPLVSLEWPHFVWHACLIILLVTGIYRDHIVEVMIHRHYSLTVTNWLHHPLFNQSNSYTFNFSFYFLNCVEFDN